MASFPYTSRFSQTAQPLITPETFGASVAPESNYGISWLVSSTALKTFLDDVKIGFVVCKEKHDHAELERV
jgi:hypothetical protein